RRGRYCSASSKPLNLRPLRCVAEPGAAGGRPRLAVQNPCAGVIRQTKVSLLRSMQCVEQRCTSLGEVLGLVTPVFAEEIEKQPVVAGPHVEEADERLVVATDLVETPAEDDAQIVTGEIPRHEGRTDDRPERLTAGDHALEQLVRHRGGGRGLRVAPPLDGTRKVGEGDDTAAG